jgi:hypothetical protein
MESEVNIYQFFRRTIAAGEIIKINAWGNYVTILASNGNSNIKISISGQALQEIPKGLSVKLPQDTNFTYLEFYNTEAAPVTIEIALSSGEIRDSRNVITGTVNVDQVGSSTASDNAEATIGNLAEVQLLAVNANRKSLSIQAKDTNTGKIYVLYKTGVGAAKYKTILQAGQIMTDDKWRGVVVAIASAAGQLACAQEET